MISDIDEPLVINGETYVAECEWMPSTDPCDQGYEY